MKIVLIGAGSYVFAGTVIHDLFRRHGLADGELIMVDLDKEAASAMAAVATRVAKLNSLNWKISGETERCKAMGNADFVILCACPQGFRRWQMDNDILSMFKIEDQMRECGGLHGLSETLRTAGLALDIARDMERLCPHAKLLAVTNPMPRVVTAVNRFSSIPALGFCSVSLRGSDGYSFLAEITGRSIHDIEVVTAGLNHFAWLISIKDKNTGENLLPSVEKHIRCGKGEMYDVFQLWLVKWGLVPAGNFLHHAEFLPADPKVPCRPHVPFHGSLQEREERRKTLLSIADGKTSPDVLFENRSWEHPVDAAIALYYKLEAAMPAVNIPNDGFMPQLPVGRIVETPLKFSNGTFTSVTNIMFPEKLAAILRSISDVHELTAEAVATKKKNILKMAIEADIAITDKKTAFNCLDMLLDAHKDMIGVYE